MDPTDSPLSIVHLLAPARFGGLETAVSSLAPALVSAGHRVLVALVLTPDEGDRHPVARALSKTGVEVETFVVPGRDYFGERRRVREVLERREADILHTHGYRPDIIDAPIGRRMGVATVTTVHGYVGGGWKNRLYEWLQVRSFRRFDAVIAVSELLSRELAATGVDPRRVHSIRNGWGPRRPPMPPDRARDALGLSPEGPVVAWVGRMSHEKAPQVMVEAAARVRTDVTFSMIGDGPERAECEEAARRLGVADRFRWHGPVSEAGALLKAFDVVVLTSWTEGTPMLLLEAMSAGVPIVTTAVGGIPDVVSPEEALLCEAGDVNAIAAAIDSVFDAPDAAKTRAEAARTRVEADFAVEPWALRHVDLYHELVRH